MIKNNDANNSSYRLDLQIVGVANREKLLMFCGIVANQRK